MFITDQQDITIRNDQEGGGVSLLTTTIHDIMKSNEQLYLHINPTNIIEKKKWI